MRNRASPLGCGRSRWWSELRTALRVAALGATVSGVTGHWAHAQASSSGSQPPADLASEINRHQRVRVRLVDRDRVLELEGSELGPDGISFSLGTFVSPASPIPLETVREIQVPHADISAGAKKGARFGLVVGAVAVVVADLTCQQCGPSNAAEQAATVGLGAILGGLGGALMGALVSAAQPGWRTVHPEPSINAETSSSPAPSAAPSRTVRLSWRF